MLGPVCHDSYLRDYPFHLKVYSTKYDIFAKEKYFQVKTQCSPSHNSMYGFSGASQCWAKSQEQCQPSGCIGTFAGQGGGVPELIPARLSYQ